MQDNLTKDELLQKDEITNKKISLTLKLKNLIKNGWQNLSVEPVLMGFFIPTMLSKMAVQNLNLEKTCRVKLEFGDEICDSLMANKWKNMTHYEKEVQSAVAVIETWKSFILTAIPTILLIFLGAWSDKTGNRKLPILLPILGEFLLCLSNIMSTYYFYEIPIEVTMFLEAILPAMSGSFVIIFLGVYSYLTDITDVKSRTFRFGILNLCLTAGIPLGMSLSGILLKLIGYYGIFISAAVMYSLTFLYGFTYLESNTKDKVIIVEDTKITVKSIVNLVKNAVEVCYKQKNKVIRTKIILMLLVVALAHGTSQAETIVTYMYVRYKLNWDAVKYSLYSTYLIIAHSFGVLITISIFDTYFQFHDSLLCIISVTSKFAGSLMVSLVNNDTEMFTVPLVDMLNATTLTTLRSITSKLVGKQDVGKINSLFGLVETLAAMFFSPIYSKLYLVTLPVFPGAIFIFSAAMTIPIIIIMMLFYMQHLRSKINT